jgi:nitroreductase
MDAMEAIMKRRSIRSFTDDPIPDHILEAILAAGAQAPSAKNRQPWRFIVVRGEKKDELVRVIREGLERIKARGEEVGSAEGTLRAVSQAPVIVFIFNPEGMHPWLTRSIHEAFTDLMNIQSVGAAIENMAVAACSLGIGSLWNGDVAYTYDEVCRFLGQDCQMVAAMSFGYPAGPPGPTSRRPLSETVIWF